MENSNTGCPNTKNILVVGRNNREKKAVFFNPACGQWSCDYCWQRNKEEWLHIAMRGTLQLLDKGNMLQFITLTGRGYFTPSSSIHFMRQNWPSLRKRIEYHTNKWADVTATQWAYLLIPERHKSGKAHWHLIAATFEDRARWWKDNAFDCGFGYMAHVRRIDNSLAAGAYVSKYMTKNAGGLEWPKGFRRARTSKNWPRPLDIIPDGWDYERIVEGEREMIIMDCEALGWTIEDRATKLADAF